MKEAILYSKLDNGNVQCRLCHHECVIEPSASGLCKVRGNKGGVLYSFNYGKLVAQFVDPVEKKPFFHFLPGSKTYSIAAAGCNLRCSYCLNHRISQYPAEHNGDIIGDRVTPEEVVETALGYGCDSISFTYTEPTIFFEFAFDVAKLARQTGLRILLKSNGYLTEEALHTLAPYLDAVNVDLKGFSDQFYRNIIGGMVTPVLECIALLNELGIWIEITTLIVPTYNDEDSELREIADFIGEVSANIPWHLPQFYPNYKMLKVPRTAIGFLHRARQIGIDAGLKYVYINNIPGEAENTYCPSCGKLLIERFGYKILKNHISNGHCFHCEAEINGVWSEESVTGISFRERTPYHNIDAEQNHKESSH